MQFLQRISTGRIHFPDIDFGDVFEIGVVTGRQLGLNQKTLVLADGGHRLPGTDILPVLDTDLFHISIYRSADNLTVFGKIGFDLFVVGQGLFVDILGLQQFRFRYDFILS